MSNTTKNLIAGHISLWDENMRFLADIIEYVQKKKLISSKLDQLI